MNKTLIFFAWMLAHVPLIAQDQTPAPEEKTEETRREETLFRNARLRGGFGGPMFSWSNMDGKTGYGAGGGGGVIIGQTFIGAFGMGEVFDAPVVGERQLALGYGGLWLGYTVPSHRLFHLYTSVKIAGGNVGTTDFDDDWDFEDDWDDVVFVAVPEAGIELNIARWMRLSGSVGYRFVDGFEGWGSYGKNDLNAMTYSLTLRFGWFGGGR